MLPETMCAKSWKYALTAALFCGFFSFFLFSPVTSAFPSGARVSRPGKISVKDPGRRQYREYFEEVYRVMDEHYYYTLKRTDYERFLKAFDEKIYPGILLEKKSNDYVRWRSSAYLIDFLKQPDDLFSRFLPPKPAEEFAQEVYGQKIDLGIEGHLEPPGFVVDFVEPRSDAYEKGLRDNDLLVRIDSQDVSALEEAGIREKLVPLAGTKVVLGFFDAVTRSPHSIEVESREYFKQTVFEKPTGIQGVYCLQIRKFNQGTPEDMARFMAVLRPRNPSGLILDLRGNPGGPPLAARAISSFFLPNGESLVYFEGRHRPRADLDIPVLPPGYQIDWPIVILVDKGTGSASELFSGVMQDRKRAIVMGEDTAGQVLLKSLFDMSDGSSLALVTARGHFPDGRPFPFEGVHPDERIAGESPEQLVSLAAKYLYVKAEGRL
jgi:carboxyl-terminal processing protease